METKPCQCGKLMILRETGMGFSNSVEHRWECQWWCNCGRTEEAPPRVMRVKSPDEIAREQWESANPPKP